MKTFKEIIHDLKEFVNNHKQLNTFGFGMLSDITTKDIVYPYLHIEPISASAQNSSIEYTFNLMILDIVKQNGSTSLDSSTNTLLIGRDFIAEFFEDNNNKDFELNNENIQGDYKYNIFDDNTIGWSFRITLQARLDLRPCITPKTT